MTTFDELTEAALANLPAARGPRTPQDVAADSPDAVFRLGLRSVLAGLGVDPDGEDVADTPARWLKALREMTAGYGQDPAEFLARQFDMPHADEMIAVTAVPFVSLCAHHLLPFSGTASIAYIPAPGAPCVGLSKLSRVLDVYARRLQSQEQITVQVTTALDTHLKTQGSACVLRASHGCMAHRGVRKEGAQMVTSSLTGLFRADPSARAEFFAHARA